MAWKPLGKKRRQEEDEEGEELELVKPAPVIRLQFHEVDEDEDLEFTEEPAERPREGYRPRYTPDTELIEAELDELTEFTEDDDREEGEDYGLVHRNVDRVTRGVPLGEEWVVREEAEGHVPKETPKKVDRSAAAKKAAETRRKNKLAKEKAAKEAAKKREEAAEARKRKEAAKKAAETRRKNQEAKQRAAEKAAETRKRNEAAKKAAETRRKNKLAKEKAEKEAAKKREEAAEARKRKAAAKKAAETRRKNRLAKEKEAEAARAAEEAKKAAGEKAYRPQCGAITSGGLQCRNSARKNSKYCASHKGYRPGSLDAALERTDTVPRAKKAEDTVPTKGTKKSKDDLRPQCGAWTSGDKQCRNSARKGSKYCASHKGYNPRSALKRMDTAPRWEKAEDTKPSLRE